MLSSFSSSDTYNAEIKGIQNKGSSQHFKQMLYIVNILNLNVLCVVQACPWTFIKPTFYTAISDAVTDKHVTV
jgi:hypothetical protein